MGSADSIEIDGRLETVSIVALGCVKPSERASDRVNEHIRTRAITKVRDTYSFGRKARVRQSVELSRELLEEIFDFLMFLFEILVQLVCDLAPLLLLARFLIVLGIDLCERFLRLRVLKLEVTRGKECVRVDGSSSLNIVEVVLVFVR